MLLCKCPKEGERRERKWFALVPFRVHVDADRKAWIWLEWFKFQQVYEVDAIHGGMWKPERMWRIKK